jgi:hypothetical protein
MLVALAWAAVVGTYALLKLLVRGVAAAWKMFGSSHTPMPMLESTKQSATTPREVAMEPVEERSISPLPAPASRATDSSHPYRTSEPMEPSIFEDKERLEAWANQSFQQWARELPMVPNDLSGMLMAVEPRTRLVGRLSSSIDARKLVWKQEPYGGAELASGAAADTAKMDPFEDAEEIRRHSRYISMCRGCNGIGEVMCGTCRGTTRVECRGCVGEGKIMGYAVDGSRRRLNCKECKGKGSFACKECRGGKIKCSSCRSLGKLERWLTVERKERTVVRLRAGGADLSGFAWAQADRDCADAEIAKDAKLVSVASHDGKLETSDLPAEVPAAWREKQWSELQEKAKAGERISSQRFLLLEMPAVELTYGFAGNRQTVAFEGLRMMAPPHSKDRVFHSRASWLRGGVAALAAGPLLSLGVYLARGPYFVTGNLLGVVACLALVAALLFGVLWNWTLRRPARWLGIGALVPAIGAAILMVKMEPSLERAQELLRLGALAPAQIELEELGRTTADEVDAWDELHLRRALQQTTCRESLGELGNVPEQTTRWATGQVYADGLAMTEARRALDRGEIEEARNALTCASKGQLDNAEGVALRVRIGSAAAERCLETRDWECAQREAEALQMMEAREAASRYRGMLTEGAKRGASELGEKTKAEQDVRVRVADERKALELWTRYVLAQEAAEPADLAALRASLAKDEGLLVKLEAQEAKQRAAEERRAAEVERRRVQAEERKRLAEERAEKRRLAVEERAERRREAASRSLVCNDGSYSPTCTCGGSWQGCCSWHGGVSGCE